MIISKVKMKNFRYFYDKTIDFNNKSVVLLSAANGIGKTTVIDAIEWCLTGSIGRLKTTFDSRSTNDKDRKLNTKGILKNRDADAEGEKVQVTIWLIDGKKEIVFSREQKEDKLDAGSSIATIDGNKGDVQKFIKEYIGDSFYNFHFCDIQKSFNIQGKKRSDLESFFSEFITNYDGEKQIADSIDVFAEDVERYMKDKGVLKESQDKIETLKEQIEKHKNEAKQLPYPDNVFYAEENTEIVGLSMDELTKQEAKLKNCGYLIAKERLVKLTENELLKAQKSDIEDIIFYLKTKEKSIRLAVSAGLFENIDSITSRQSKLSQIEKLSLSKDTILQDVESVIAFENGSSMKIESGDNKKVIQEKKKKVKELSDEIDLLSKNNKMLKLLSNLYVNKQAVIDYRNATFNEQGTARCPICGSESFGTMEEALILKEANDYIKRNGEIVRLKEVEKTKLQEEIEELFQKMIKRTRTVIEEKKSILTKEINELKILQNETQPYFDTVKKLQKYRKEIKIEELTLNKAGELLTDLEQKLLSESKEDEEKESYKKILTVLGYNFENETLKQTLEKVKNLITGTYEVTNFSYETFVSKINAINSIKANYTLYELNKKLDDCEKKNQNIEAEIKKLENLKDKADQKAKNIREIVGKLSKDEYEKVGPALSKYYNKLIRLNSNNKIKIVHEKEGISLVDDKNNNIVNMLSNGQISVFMLAYFFAGISVRNEHEKMKVFFIDDLTACMDDVNMLAFMDLLKYQISSKKTMEQLFFITCDERISALLKYKLEGRGIELCTLKEKDFIESTFND